MRNFWLGVVATLVFLAVVGVIVMTTGAANIAASQHTALLDHVLGYASGRAIRHHARDEANPLAKDPTALKRGDQLYGDLCADCHGGPGRRAESYSQGLHPSAPKLNEPWVQDFSDGMLYWTIANGIHSTGMPAFGRTHPPPELWSIVAYLRQLPKGAASAGAATDGGTAGVEGPAVRGDKVTISGLKFQPPVLEVGVGQEVTFTNSDFVDHTATADDGHSFDTGRIGPNGSKRIRVPRPGRYPYSCRFHNGMHGTLIVR